MRGRTTVRVALLAIAVLMLGLIAPVTASGQAQAKIRVRGGTTTLVTASGLVNKLLDAEIVSFVTAPGTSSLISGPALVAKYPVSGGNVVAHPPSGTINHRGGLLVVNVSNGKKIAVDRFTVDITRRILTAHLVGTTSRLTVFTLGLRRAIFTVRPHSISISRIRVLLEKNAANALDALLGTTVFKPGMLFGTASSKLRR